MYLFIYLFIYYKDKGLDTSQLNYSSFIAGSEVHLNLVVFFSTFSTDESSSNLETVTIYHVEDLAIIWNIYLFIYTLHTDVYAYLYDLHNVCFFQLYQTVALG